MNTQDSPSFDFEWEERDRETTSVAEHMISGSLSGLFEHLLFLPLENIKVHQFPLSLSFSQLPRYPFAFKLCALESMGFGLKDSCSSRHDPSELLLDCESRLQSTRGFWVLHWGDNGGTWDDPRPCFVLCCL